MPYNSMSLVFGACLIIAIVYAIATTKSMRFARYTIVLNANIEKVSFIVVLMMVSLYLLRIRGITTETFDVPFKVCDIDETNTDQQEKHDYCLKLSPKTCTASTCCILLNGEKCVGRTGSAPTFSTIGSKKVSFDYSEWKDVRGETNCIGCPE